MRKKLLIGLFFVGYIHLIYSQNRIIDSLNNSITNSKQDTAKISTYLDLFWEHINLGEDSMAFIKVNRALDLSIKINYQKGLSSSYTNLGIYNYVTGNYEKALLNYDKAIEIARSLKNEPYLARNYANKANTFVMQSNYKKALTYFILGLKIYEKVKDKVSVAQVLGNIGTVYHYQKNFTKAIEYYSKTVALNITQRDSIALANAYTNLSAAYRELKELDKSWLYNKKALIIDSVRNNVNGMAVEYNNFAAICDDKKAYAEAIVYSKKALEIRESINDLYGVASSLNNLGISHNGLKQYALAKIYFNRAIEINKELKSTEVEINTSEGLSLTLFNTGNYKDAYLLQRKFKQLNDSIFNIENTKQLSDTKTQYEVDKKEIELTAQSKLEKEKLSFTANEKSKRLQLIIAFVALASIVAAFLAIYMRKRYKISQQQKQLIEEKNKKITDSLNYAQKIQNSILPNTEQIKQYLPESFIFLKPKDVVSGDFFYLNYSDNKSFIAVVDCTGHGVPGAFMSMIGHTLLNEIIMAKKIHQANLILNELHRSIYKELQQGLNKEQAQDGMDIALCVYDHTTSELQFAGARNALYLLENGKVTLVKGDAKSIGGLTLRGEAELERNFSLQRLTITHQTKLFMSSDGYLDQISTSSNQKFGNKQFIELLESFANKGMNECGEIVASTFENWKQEESQMDDVLVLGCKVGKEK